ncbi:hypothetical protein BASA62_008306 [Batrachochytrium salamandrivorans]|nr:hypothetical protein BASA62_008306 [Batrachochytrium salamandrivorans]
MATINRQTADVAPTEALEAIHNATLAVNDLTLLATPWEMPDASASYMPVLVQGLSNIKFADASFFDIDQYFDAKSGEKATASKFFQKEVLLIGKMQEVLAEGRQLIYTLYSFRSCGRAIPPVQAHDQGSKEHLYRRTYEILRPEIGRMIQLMTFRDKFIAVFTDTLASIIPDIRDREFFPSEAYLLMIANVLDLVVSLDSMKNMKGSMNNDLSMYKRAMSNFPKEQSESELMILPKLVFFVAQQDQFANDIKKALSTMSSTYEDIFHDMINICVDYTETQQYTTPLEKNIYLRAMAFAVTLLDGESDDRDFTKRKRLKVERLGKIFKATPFVPLFGDIVTSLPAIYSKAPHFANAKWESLEADDVGRVVLQKAFRLSTTIQESRFQFKDYLSQAKVSITNLEAHKKQKGGKIQAELSKRVYDMTLLGLRLLSGFTIKVTEQTAYKFLHPASRGVNSSIPEDATSYELAVRYNYDSEDKRTLIEYITMIKSISGFLNANIVIIQEAVDRTIFRSTQGFLRGSLTQYYASALKKKKPVSAILKYIRDTGVDDVVDDDILPKTAPPVDFSEERSDPISASQLHFIRTLLDFIFNEKSKGMKGGLIKEKTFKDIQVVEMQRFFDESFFYLPMIRLQETIRDCSDLSTLWFKEFYLELSRKVQFPISTSLPWILTEYILETNDADNIQYVFYPLDLYNDAGYRTLYDLKSRVIFDEIEAEVNLCFDQFMFKLGQRIFLHYKKAASLLLLPSDLKVELDSIIRPEALCSNSYEFIMKQSSFELLGRSINVSKVIAQSVNQYIRRSIEVAITRFESSDILYISELESLLNSARLTHSILSKHMELESFKDLLAECDDSLSLSASNGRIVSHVIHELVKDFIPNFCYNSITQRFIRSPVFYTQPIQRSHFPKTRLMYLFGSKALSAAYTAHNVIFKEFFGEPHIQCLIRLLTPSQIGLVVSEITHHVELMIQHTMAPYIDALHQRSPAQIKSTLVASGFSAMFDHYCSEYKQLITYGDLKSEALQAFREIGNSVTIIKAINDHVTICNSLSKVTVQEFVSTDPGQQSYMDILKDLNSKLAFENFSMPLTQWCDGVTDISRVVSYPVGLLQSFVNRTKSTLLSTSGTWGVESDQILVNTKAFVNIWSGLEFVCCLPGVAGNDRVIREVFGDGLAWGGCLFMHIFGQDRVYPGISITAHLLSAAQMDSTCGWTSANTPQSSTAKNTETTGSMRPDIKRCLETAQFFSNINETAFAILRAI